MHFNHSLPFNPIQILSLTYARSVMRFYEDVYRFNIILSILVYLTFLLSFLNKLFRVGSKTYYPIGRVGKPLISGSNSWGRMFVQV